VDNHDAQTFVAAARIAADLATSPQVAQRWTDESACAGMTVGGLAHHLFRQATVTVQLLAAPPVADAELVSLLGHYERAAWVTAGPDAEVNVGVREGSNADAAGGPEELRALVEATLAELPAALAAPREPETVHIPWQGWSLTTHDYVVTRLMEMVVHSDDLAASIGVPTPEFPEEVVAPVLGLLSGVAVRRHGQAAVVRALSRPQRAPASVSAF
jgi:mycothiol maleylpyruvate isomerase-like protein